MLTITDRLTAIREARPSEGLFAEKDWLLSPEPFAIDEKLRADLEREGTCFIICDSTLKSFGHSVKSTAGSRYALIRARTTV